MNGLSKFELERVVKVRKWLRFANITICLYKANCNLAPEAQRKLFRLIYQYITNHRGSRWVSRQSFAFGPDIVAFTILSKDLPKIQKAISNILQTPHCLTRDYIPVERNSMLESIFPFLKVKRQRIWRVSCAEA